MSELASLRKADAELLKQKGRVVSLIVEVSKLQYELDDLLARQRTRATGSEQAALRTTIFNLKQKVDARDNLLDCFEALETDNIAFAVTSFKQECNGLYLNLDDTDMSGLLNHAQNVKIPKNKLLACLLAVGTFQLVFEPAFPKILCIESPLFQQYRNLIATSAGTKILRTLDLAATQSLLTNLAVKEELISDKKLALSVKRFQYRFFQPGSPFDSELMEYDISHARDLAMSSKGIKLCMFPAIFSVEEQVDEVQKDVGNDFEENYNDITEARSDDLKSLKVVAKARVLL
ncbi:hypothetical protein FOXB_09300 [Fusarium oxysporum f. sp. conglutinans Fo5176]|uniref:Uncharacterized protein n=1 Tax=Fusarium oxysporum (strain Fo5176) TaxID=660025 RepID=F9FSB9_FUSOF|nr:hypothetical protein FOXB_09300 [Fusarium oxysporum f. sp. conglutinans Fo5176]